MEQVTLMKPKWQDTVSAKITGVSADQIWTLVKDFFGLYKYFPNLKFSYGIEGNNGEVGAIRFCELLAPPSSDGHNGDKPEEEHWVKEKITAIDPDQRYLTFEIVDGNVGLNSYVATLKVANGAVDNDMAHTKCLVQDGYDQDGQSLGCVLEWSFSFDAMEGAKFEDFVKRYQMWIDKWAQNMKDSLVKSSQVTVPENTKAQVEN